LQASFRFDRRNNLLIATVDGVERHAWECRNTTVGSKTSDPYGYEGMCPPGDYFIGTPQILVQRERPYGFAFTPLIDTPQSMAQRKHGRKGIGVHGGGSGCDDPFCERQGWCPTDGCLRLQNIDNYTPGRFTPCFVTTVQYLQVQCHKNIILTVV
jgi:hypothetical protein